MVEGALTSAEAGRRLGKSRRQVYRYMKSGLLPACGKFLGEWLFSPEEVAHLKRLLAWGRLRSGEKRRARVPDWLSPLFPEFDTIRLHPFRDAPVILERVLERGDLRAARWAIRIYPRSWWIRFMRRRAGRTLSGRSRAFWAAFLGIPTPAEHPWSGMGRAWGGAG